MLLNWKFLREKNKYVPVLKEYVTASNIIDLINASLERVSMCFCEMGFLSKDLANSPPWRVQTGIGWLAIALASIHYLFMRNTHEN